VSFENDDKYSIRFEMKKHYSHSTINYPVWDCRSTVCKLQNSCVNGGTGQWWEGHVTLNEDEYQKSVPLKFTDIVSEYRKPPSVF